MLISPREQVLGWLKAVVIQYCQNELLAEKWKFKTCIRLITVASNNQIVNFVQSSLFDIHKVVRMVVNLTKWGIQYMFRIFLLFLLDNQSRSWPKKFVSGFSQKSLSITSAKKSPFLASANKIRLRLQPKKFGSGLAKKVRLWLQPKMFISGFSQKGLSITSAKKVRIWLLPKKVSLRLSNTESRDKRSVQVQLNARVKFSLLWKWCTFG